MNCIVLYRSKYGATKKYAEWIAEELDCEAKDTKNVAVDELLQYDPII